MLLASALCRVRLVRRQVAGYETLSRTAVASWVKRQAGGEGAALPHEGDGAEDAHGVGGESGRGGLPPGRPVNAQFEVRCCVHNMA